MGEPGGNSGKLSGLDFEMSWVIKNLNWAAAFGLVLTKSGPWEGHAGCGFIFGFFP